MFTLDLPVRLTAEEQRLKGEQLAKLYDDRQKVEAEKTRVAQELGAKLKNLDKDIRDLADQVKECREMREVQCREEKDHGSGTVLTVRMDTGEVVSSRAMKLGERQVEMLPGGLEDDEVRG